jgi:predicted small secreted protein
MKTMRRPVSVVLILLALAGATPLLSACHTAAGAGEDLSAAGHAVTGEAKKLTP